METRYTVSLKKTEEGYSGWVPSLPGCASQGETEQKDAIREYLEVAEQLGAEGERREVTAVVRWGSPESRASVNANAMAVIVRDAGLSPEQWLASPSAPL